MDCLFCKIIKKEIPNYTIYEDDNTLAFLDINPRCKGHTVIIPKTHAETLPNLNEEFCSSLLVAVKRVQERMEKALSPDGYNVGWNHGDAGGQVVPHLHIHVLPRWKGDGGGNIHSIIKNPGEIKVEEVFNLLTDNG